jgi:hypothetical protein
MLSITCCYQQLDLARVLLYVSIDRGETIDSIRFAGHVPDDVGPGPEPNLNSMPTASRRSGSEVLPLGDDALKPSD